MVEPNPHSPVEPRQRRACLQKEHGVDASASECGWGGSRVVGVTGREGGDRESESLGPLQYGLHVCAARDVQEASVSGQRLG